MSRSVRTLDRSAGSSSIWKGVTSLALALIFGCAPSILVGQSLDTLVAPRRDSLDLTIEPSVTLDGQLIRYGYTLSSLPSSSQDLFVFGIAVPAGGVSGVLTPSGWTAAQELHLGMELPDRQVFGWGEILNEEPLTPGSTVTGLAFDHDWLPGSVSWWAQGSAQGPVVGTEPDVVVGDRLIDNSVTGQTLGPAFPPGEVATPVPTAAALEEVLTLSCEQGWVSDPAVCIQMEQALSEVQSAVATGDLPGAGGALDAFEQIVNAEVGGTINESAFSALDLYIARLRGQGLVPDLGGEGCGPGYWKQSHHFDSWQAHAPSDLFDSVFSDAFPGGSLHDVLKQGGGGLNSLGRQSVAALLNAEHDGVSYALTPLAVVSEFDAAFGQGGGAIEDQKDRFEGFNEEVCPLD